MKSFSFISNRFKPVFEMANKILPSLEKAMVFYYDENERKVLQISWSNDGQIIDPVLPMIKVEIQKLRKDKNLTNWTNIKDLVFESEERSDQQYSLSDEVNNSILCLKFLNPFDGAYDLLYLYLDNSLSQFQMNSKFEVLSTGNKAILEKTLLQSIDYLLHQHESNKSVLQNIIDAKNQEKEERNTLIHELDLLKKNYAKSILNYSLHHLDIIAKEEGVKFKLTDSASNKLMTYVGDFESLENIIKKAASAAFNLSYDHEEI
ncbi:MAG: hypothetical protein JKY54_19615, partial [Flavobacteriales bacterium]|nr:hypothetical protein [Flavobacteriales bacterium]